MKFSLECKVDSTIKLPNNILVSYNELEYYFYCGNDKNFNIMKIVSKVSDPSKFYSTIEAGDSHTPHKITLNGDKELYQKLIKEFQLIEAALTLNGMKKIYWNQPKYEVIPETDEERSKLAVYSFEHKLEYPKREVELNESALSKIIKTTSRYSELLILENFLREGQNEYTQFRFIQAFYNFYFVIEDLYGGGKTKNDQIESNFKASADLTKILGIVLKTIETTPKHKATLERFLKEKGLEFSAINIIHLIVLIRGSLHHFSGKSTLRQGTPLNQEEFETIAFLLYGIALHAILFRIVEINNRPEHLISDEK